MIGCVSMLYSLLIFVALVCIVGICVEWVLSRLVPYVYV